MPLLHSSPRAIARASPAPVAHAHCDIPCGIYDPHHAQLAAHTVIRMVDLLGQLEPPGPDATLPPTKEQHAEVYKSEVRILWADYFKPEHLQQFPQLHDLVWKALKAGSKARQEGNLQASADMRKPAT